jgi:hypothetical protein
MKFRVFWDVLSCSQIDVDQHFRGAYCLHHQGDECALREKVAGYIGVQVDWADQWGMVMIGEEVGQWQMGGWSVVEERERYSVTVR